MAALNDMKTVLQSEEFLCQLGTAALEHAILSFDPWFKRTPHFRTVLTFMHLSINSFLAELKKIKG